MNKLHKFTKMTQEQLHLFNELAKDIIAQSMETIAIHKKKHAEFNMNPAFRMLSVESLKVIDEAKDSIIFFSKLKPKV